jgi:hypothetical protein
MATTATLPIQPKYVNPAWTHDEHDAGYQECGEALWELALVAARKFGWGSAERIHGFDVQDLAALAVLHVFLQAKLGRLDKVPAGERWNVIFRIMWNKLVDESRRFRNTREVQTPTIIGEDGNPMDSDDVLALIAANNELAEDSKRRVGCPVPRRELRLLESMLDEAFARLQNADALLIKMRFGLCRNDEITGRFEPIQFLPPMTLEELSGCGYGSDRFAVKRRLDGSLERLKTHLMQELGARRIMNFTT